MYETHMHTLNNKACNSACKLYDLKRNSCHLFAWCEIILTFIFTLISWGSHWGFCWAGWHALSPHPLNAHNPCQPPIRQIHSVVCFKLCLIIALREVGRVSPFQLEHSGHHDNSSIKDQHYWIADVCTEGGEMIKRMVSPYQNGRQVKKKR